MRISLVIFLALAWGLLSAEPADYETTIELNANSAGSFLAKIEERLEINLRSDEIASKVESLGPGLVVQREFDITRGGATFEAIYQVAHLESGRVSISFSAYQRRTIEAICREFLRASSDGEKDQFSKSCDFSKPETFRI